VQLELKRHQELDIDLGVDENDEEIVNLDVNLRSVNERMNSFVLEAALLGALAFSCFLQIIATDEFTIASIELFSLTMMDLFFNLVNFQWEGTKEALASLGGKEELLSLMCYESLLCSAFFLAVIASRLQFSVLTDFVDRAINLARSFNSKEESLVYGNQVEVSDERVVAYNKRIKEELKMGYRKQGEIEPIMEFMSFFRTLGVTTFFIIVITGGLFVSVQLSFVLLLISLLSAFYFKFTLLIRTINRLKVKLEEFSFGFNRHFSWAAWLLIALAVVARSLNFEWGGVILSAGLSLLILQHLLLLFLPNPDEIMNQANEKIAVLSNRMRIYFIFIFVFCILGAVFKYLHLLGAGLILVLSSVFLSVFFFSNAKLKEGPKWMGRIVSAAMGLLALAFLAKMQHWPIARGFYILATLPMLFSLYVLVKKWGVLSKLNRRAIIYFAFILLTFYVPFLKHSFVNMKLDYAGYLQSGASEVLEDEANKYIVSENDGYPDSVIHYMELLEVQLDAAPRRDVNLYNEIAWHIYENRNDSLVLAKGLEWSTKGVELRPTWTFIDTRAALLYKLGRYKEAEVDAVRAIELGAERETEQLLRDIRKKLR